MVLRDKGYTGCTTFVDLLTSGDLYFGHMVTKIFLCTPWYIIHHRYKFGVYGFISFRGVRGQTHRHTDGLTVLII